MKLASFLLIAMSALADSLTTVSNGVRVNYEARLEPDTPPISKQGGGVLTENNVIKRHLCNFENNTYFGYDLAVEPIGDKRYRLRFSPLSITPQQMSGIFKQVSNWTLLPLPGGAVTLEAKAGETVALDLFVNPSTSQKITDYLTVGGEEKPPAGAAIDFALSEVNIELSHPEVSADGKRVDSWPGGISGPSVWIDIPGYGRFVFSLAPRPDLGIQKAGEIRGKKMTWRLAGHEYAIQTNKPIASGSRPYNLYVGYIPRQPRELRLFAGPRPDDPIRQQ